MLEHRLVAKWLAQLRRSKGKETPITLQKFGIVHNVMLCHDFMYTSKIQGHAVT